MDEIKFVVKSLVWACLLFALSQYRLEDGQTIEARVHGYLISSSVASFVNESAHGGVKVVRNVSNEVSEYFGWKKAEVKRRPIHSAVQRKNTQIESQNDDIDLE